MILFRNIKNYHPANFLILVFVGLIFWMRNFISRDLPGIYYDADPMPIYNWIYSGLVDLVLLSKILAFLLVMLQVIIINSITNQYNLLGFRSYLPGFFYILVISNFPAYQVLSPLLFANLLFIAAWERVASITEKSNSFKAFFNASFFLGLATLFYPNYIYFIIVFIFGTVLNRISSPREFIMIILGFITVWYFYFTINYILFDVLQMQGIELKYELLNKSFLNLSPGQLIFFVFAVLFLFMASLQLSTYVSNLKIQIRRNLKILFIWFLVSLFVFIFTKSSLELIYVCAIPLASLFAIYLSNIKRKWMPEVIWLLIVGITIINQYFPNVL